MASSMRHTQRLVLAGVKSGSYAIPQKYSFHSGNIIQNAVNAKHGSISLFSGSRTVATALNGIQSRSNSNHTELSEEANRSERAFITVASLGGEGGSGHGHGHGSWYATEEFRRLGWVALFAVGTVIGGNVLISWDTPVEAALFGKKGKPSSEANKMLLYWASGSPPCWRVTLTLEEKGITDYPNKLLSMEKKEHKSEEVFKLNPRGQVPTFSHDGNVISESVAIVEYVETVFKDQGTALIPEDRAKLAVVLQKKYEALLLFSKGIEGHFFYSFNKPEDKTQGEIDSRLKAFRDELSTWDAHFKQMGPCNYAAGRDFSVADIIFFPTIALMWRLGLNLDKYPNIKAYFERTKQRPSIQKTWPPHWRGAPRSAYLEDV